MYIDLVIIVDFKTKEFSDLGYEVACTPTLYNELPEVGYAGKESAYRDSNDYSSNSDKYSDNISECESENCSDYGSDYESDTETNQVGPRCPSYPATTFTKRQEKFDNKFTQKDLLNKIHEIASSLAINMSNNKGSLEDVYLWDYLLPNNGAKRGISLYDAYTREELADKLVIQVEQGEYKKYSVIDEISEVYGLFGIHESIDGQRPLRPVIDIDASSEKMEAENVNARDVFIHICCSFIRALYRILDCNWEDIFEGLVIMTSSDSSKCSYHFIYAPVLLIDHLELKEFTELVYRLTGEKYGKFIDRRLPGRNFNLRLIGSAKKDRVKHIFQFSLDNGWNKLDHARVQPPTSLNIQVRPRILSVENINNRKKIIVGQDALKKYANQVMGTYPDYLGSWDIEEKNSQWYVYFNQKSYLECPICERTHDKDQRKNPAKNKNNTSTSNTYKAESSGFPKTFLKMPSWIKCNELFITLERYEERYVKPLSKENDIYIGSPWETGKTYAMENLNIPENTSLFVVSTRHTYSDTITTRLNLKSYCDIDGSINLREHQRVVCQVESLHRITNKCKCDNGISRTKKCKCIPNPYILALDEIVLVIVQTQTRLSDLSISLINFSELITQAERVIVLDNDLTDLNIEWIKGLRPNRKYSIIHNTYKPQKNKTYRLVSDKETVLVELWGWAKQMSSLSFEKRKSASLICHERRNIQGIVRSLKEEFPNLHIKEYHNKFDPIEND
ncbi:hypothetical protein Glove_426g16 [Diversispora epigaea]|uniref:Replication origin-binding protein domain-containing protein n=1 Tax=Diversispora epigaea TaxID=1348612 RepID=A0A397GZW9_9GLOM|nr:hypothetical protein Glove_426g16 [Diversispora epigaea]